MPRHRKNVYIIIIIVMICYKKKCRRATLIPYTGDNLDLNNAAYIHCTFKFDLHEHIFQTCKF